MNKKYILLGLLSIILFIAAASPRGVVKYYNLVVYSHLIGGDDWRRHAHGNGGADTDDTLTTTGTSATDAVVVSWHGQTVGTIPLAAVCGTNYTIITCAAADTSLFRTGGYAVIIVR